jgi:DNA replication licensing factor MCM3
MLSIAPNSINTTGRGSSGVGLTAAVVVDKDTGERHLEAGAMVLGDRGVVCIDEFDKMNELDRVAIHEVMEQQTVTIAKAGIHVSLNARCSVLAAANPIYGEYQRDIPAAKNIGLPDSLLSRFDLVFIVLDEKNSEMDRKIADRVIKNHMFPLDSNTMMNLYDEKIIEPEINPEENQETQVFEKHNVLIHGNVKRDILTGTFLKKYLYFTKKSAQPVLTEEATEYISTAWTKLRSMDDDEFESNFRAVPITVRTLETLIRLSTAHAKLRQSKVVAKRDCEVAFEMLTFALYHETGKEDEPINDDYKQKKSKKTKKEEPKDEEAIVEVPIPKSAEKKVKKESQTEEEKVLSASPITDSQKKFVWKNIYDNANKRPLKQINISELWEIVSKHPDVKKHNIESKQELLNIVLALNDDNRLLYTEISKDIILID